MSEDQHKRRETGESPAFQRMIDRLMEAIRVFEREVKEGTIGSKATGND